MMPESVHSQDHDQAMADAPQDQKEHEQEEFTQEDILELEDTRVIVVRTLFLLGVFLFTDLTASATRFHRNGRFVSV